MRPDLVERTSQPRPPGAPHRHTRRRPARRAPPRRPRRSGGSRPPPAPGRSPTASRTMSATGSGASQRRSTTRHADALVGQPGRGPQRHPHPVAEGDDGQVVGRADPVDPGPADRHVAGRPRARLRRSAASHSPSPSVVQVAGVVERDRLQEHADAAVHRGARPGRSAASARRRPAAPAPRPPARACRAVRPPSCRCGSARRSPPGRPARRPAPPSGCGTRPCEKNCMVAASPRSWSSALCRYARYWISGTGSSPASPAPSAEPEDRRLVQQRVEDPGRAEPVPQALGHPVHAALGGHVLAEDAPSAGGRAARR